MASILPEHSARRRKIRSAMPRAASSGRSASRPSRVSSSWAETRDGREAERPEDAARGIALRIFRLLAECSGSIEAINHEEGHEEGSQKRAEVAGTEAGRPGIGRSLYYRRFRRRTAEEETERMAMEEKQQHEGEANHTDDLGSDTKIVDDRHQSHANDVDERANNNREYSNKDRGLQSQYGCRHAGENSFEWDRDGISYSRYGKNAGKEIDPAGKPAQAVTGEAPAPLIDRTGYREVRGKFREIERYQKLSNGDNGPGPEERRAAGQNAQGEE